MPSTWTPSQQGEFPHTIQPVSPELNDQLKGDFSGERSGFVRVGRDGWLLPERYEQQALGYYTLPLRPDDVWIQTFPRSGTTWCQEMVWLINNDYDYQTAKSIPLDTRFPFLEFGMLHHPQLHEEVLAQNNFRTEVAEVLKRWRTPGAELAEPLPSPRHFKTHLPLPLLPPSLLDTCKVIYVARNPLDVAVSYFHHNRYLAVHGYNGDFEKYWRYFQIDLLVYSPYWEHVKQAWAVRKHPNFLFLFYEDLLKNLPKNIRIISDFLGKTVNEEQLSKLTNHLQIDNFRNNVPLYPDVEITGLTREEEQGFIRKGKLKGNKEFTEELEAEANKWMKENLAGTDLRFPTK
ncbi:sulfotransferase 1B1-like isoform X1 [Macrosteles quadrilineatus]|uniref:sulfotransferase 1B1-like isoform X1 n=1 Tax=Macrosteles quadrilineatus TaxID=74068 RepID=UPI0023E23FDC|nr:sulfotransferase 1B1-like isoform X1 [Macrosteles quadrilineatus]